MDGNILSPCDAPRLDRLFLTPDRAMTANSPIESNATLPPPKAGDATKPHAALRLSNLTVAKRIAGRWLPFFAFLAVGCIYLFASPNYQWSPSLGAIPYGADFLQEWTGGRMILDGQIGSIYSERFVEAQHDASITGFQWDADQFFPAVYPPPHYLLFSPWGALPYRYATIAWLAFLLFAGCLASFELQCIATAEGQAQSYAWLAVLLFPPFLLSVTLGQKSGLWLLLFALMCRRCQRDRWFTAGLLAGLMTIKPTLCFLLPLPMLIERRWHFLGGMALSTTALWGASACVFPQEAWSGFLSIVSTAGRYTDQGGFHLDWSCNLLSLASSLPEGWTTWGKWAISLPLALYAILAVAESRGDWNDPKRWMLLLTATILLSPHFYHYDLCILLLPIVWMLRSDWKRGACYFVSLSLAMVLASDVHFILQIPLLPIVLLGILCELRLSDRFAGWSTKLINVPQSMLPAHH